MKSAFIALGQAFSLTASINSILTRFSPSVRGNNNTILVPVVFFFFSNQ